LPNGSRRESISATPLNESLAENQDLRLTQKAINHGIAPFQNPGDSQLKQLIHIYDTKLCRLGPSGGPELSSACKYDHLADINLKESGDRFFFFPFSGESSLLCFSYELIRGRRHYLNVNLVRSYMFQLVRALHHMHRKV
jgi:hypothetical protein